MSDTTDRKKPIRQPADKRRLSDTTIKMLLKHRAPAGKRVFYRDDSVNGFAIMVTDRGSLSYVFEARVVKGGKKGFARRAIGKVGSMTLAAARDRAKAWSNQIGEGKDPKEEERKAREKEAAESAATFASVAEAFIEKELKNDRKGPVVTREIRRELIPGLGKMPITRIKHAKIVELLDAIAARSKNGSGAYARNIYGHSQRIFKWAIQRGKYGLEHSPLANVSSKDLFGEKRKRKRVLDDDELRALWRAATREGYPYGDILKWLLLTGVRKNDAALARRREFNRKTWVIPEARAKMERPYVVPLTDDMREFYAALPKWEEADEDYLFTSDGEIPFNGFSKAKRRLDRSMTRTWRALARLRGEDRRKVKMDPWQQHDLRRTVRTRFAKLRIEYEVAELAIGHVKAGLQGNYDQHEYEDEIREAFEKWNRLLMSIVEPDAPPSNVVKLRGRAK